MKKLSIVLVLLLAGTAAAGRRGTGSGPAFATASASTNSSGWLITNFKESGLNPAELQVTYEFSAFAIATYGCASRKTQTTLGQTAGLQTVNVTMQIAPSGTITNGMAIEPPGPEAGWSCPAGTSLELLQVSYSQVALQDVTNGITASLTGSCALGCTDVLVSSK